MTDPGRGAGFRLTGGSPGWASIRCTHCGLAGDQVALLEPGSPRPSCQACQWCVGLNRPPTAGEPAPTPPVSVMALIEKNGDGLWHRIGATGAPPA